MSNGIVYSAYGKNAIDECLKSIDSLKHSNPDIETCVLTDDRIPFRIVADKVIEFESDKFGRWAKLNADLQTPFNNTLYLDADTRIRGSLEPIFYWLNSGFEFITTISARQGDSWLWQVPDEERQQTLFEIGFVPPQLQGGVWAFRRTPNVRAFMASWRKEWQVVGNKHDQAALSRAFAKKPMKTLLIGSAFNGGVVIQHLFGRAESR